jgi:hypothetical protein
LARGRKPRTWIKIDCEGILRGSINYLLDLDGQAIWVKMIALSEVCGGRPGYIEDNNQKGLPHEYLAHELHCPVELLRSVLDKMSGDDAIEVNSSGSIHLVNFHHYQFGEYERQKPYRQKKKEMLENLPEFIDKELWQDFLDMRTKMRKPPTEKAKTLLFKDLEKLRDAGDDPNEVLKQSIKSNWAGVFPLKDKQPKAIDPNANTTDIIVEE